jgi:hypothetical protein
MHVHRRLSPGKAIRSRSLYRGQSATSGNNERRLPPCTVFQLELRAIQMACEHLCLHEQNNKYIHIHVDSQAALQLLVKLQITSKTVRQTVELLRELAVRHTVTLQ